MARPADWRAMATEDLPAVKTLADHIHVDHPEDMAVFEERLALYPDGCRVLEEHGRLIGYALTHPWRFGAPPALNSRLQTIPVDATTYYLHDVALLPDARGKGHAAGIVNQIAEHARTSGFDNLSLVAVNGSRVFWERLGFREAMTQALRRKLSSYGSDSLLMRRELSPSGT
ncbi:GNAT family N-acetyltransferase [Microvirga rosea]|uniref:GNAT family N-acetyltransferase n=1 Tax=Microvirga rosea TaxID=2715425 RepID=UPI001D09CFB3|nr:GNAT family N-acetyltransferase [Microvirga rosea]MCB8820082.1 GNAT family N-acetyltransferase [Microvirga rosea]